MTLRRSRLLSAFTVLTATGVSAAITPALSEPFNVGRTTLQCYTQPCPWNGVWPADQAAQPNNLVWSGPKPPAMTGNAADLKRIRADYLERCTLVEAQFSEGVLAVSKIIGAC